MSVSRTARTARALDDEPTVDLRERRRDDLDRDLVAVLGMVAIVLLTVLCFLGRTALPA